MKKQNIEKGDLFITPSEFIYIDLIIEDKGKLIVTQNISRYDLERKRYEHTSDEWFKTLDYIGTLKEIKELFFILQDEGCIK